MYCSAKRVCILETLVTAYTLRHLNPTLGMLVRKSWLCFPLAVSLSSIPAVHLTSLFLGSLTIVLVLTLSGGSHHSSWKSCSCVTISDVRNALFPLHSSPLVSFSWTSSKFSLHMLSSREVRFHISLSVPRTCQ